MISTVDKEALLKTFLNAYQKYKDRMLQEYNEIGVPPDTINWISEMSDYNTLGGKMNRGLCVVEAALIINQGKLPEEQLGPFLAIGWCIEWLQASFLIADDIMDASTTRRNQPCWYRKEQVGMVSINDCFMLHSMIFHTIRRELPSPECYHEILDLFIDIKMMTELGQLLDLLNSSSNGIIKFEKFTEENYRRMIRLKTAYYSFLLPIKCSLIVTKQMDPKLIIELEGILLDLGELFQIQDDYLDCYGDVKMIGKVGTDILEGKCTWLIVRALADPQLNETLKVTLRSHYGKNSEESESLIKTVYRKLNIQNQFLEYQSKTQSNLKERIEKLSLKSFIYGEIANNFANRIFNREK